MSGLAFCFSWNFWAGNILIGVWKNCERDILNISEDSDWWTQFPSRHCAWIIINGSTWSEYMENGTCLGIRSTKNDSCGMP